MKNLKFLLIGILVFQFLNTGMTQNSNQTSTTKMNKYKELKGDDLEFATEALNTLDSEFYNQSEIDNILKLQAKYITENFSAFD